jgi:SAM-dependent methyltransferase
MKQYFDEQNNRLVCIGKTANDALWDQHWKTEDLEFEKQIKIKNNRLVVGYTKKYLPRGSKILEAGCGRGDKVYALCHHGYKAYGVDYAKKTVEKINQYAPELKITLGDVRNLDFNEGFFDGYWSLGVIEHFYDGYDSILNQANRVLRDRGYLFLTTPVMSWLRKYKVKNGKYPQYRDTEQMRENFYQFLFEPQEVISNLKDHGFNLIETRLHDGVKGFKDEVEISKPLLQYLYDKPNVIFKLTKKMLDIVFRRFANHICLFVAQKMDTN